MAKRKLSTFERLNQDQMNRKQRKELARRICSDDPGPEVVHRNVAGIDVGNARETGFTRETGNHESHYVAVAPAAF